MNKILIAILTLFTILFSPPGWVRAQGSAQVPILLYHRFGPVAADSMTVTTTLFESHLRYLRDNGYQVVPLRDVVDHFLGKRGAPPPRSVAITVDDGHISVYREMFPLVKRYRVPAALFIYP